LRAKVRRELPPKVNSVNRVSQKYRTKKLRVKERIEFV